MSKGEELVAKILRENGFQYKREVSIPGMNGFKEPLRFDFVVFKNNKFCFALEVDGEQHFSYVSFFHKTKMGFNKAKEMDRRKNSFCLVNKIPLIRIPYWELEGLSIKTIFNPAFLVKSKFHNDLIGRN